MKIPPAAIIVAAFGTFIPHQQVSAQTQCFTGTATAVKASCDALTSNNCCTAANGCGWPSSLDDKVTICEGSCLGGNVCQFGSSDATEIYIEENACTNGVACGGIGNGGVTRVKTGSCTAYSSCRYVKGNVGAGSCTSSYACHGADGEIGAGSCKGNAACRNILGDVGDNSCNAGGACRDAGSTCFSTTLQTIGDDSCSDGASACEGAALVGNNVDTCGEDEICGISSTL